MPRKLITFSVDKYTKSIRNLTYTEKGKLFDAIVWAGGGKAEKPDLGMLELAFDHFKAEILEHQDRKDVGPEREVATQAMLIPMQSRSEFHGQAPNKYHPFFEKFWGAYPKRNGKKAGKRRAYESWWKIVRDRKATPNELLDAIIRLAPTYEEYPKDAATWLNGQCWEDEVESAQAQPEKSLSWEEILGGGDQ